MNYVQIRGSLEKERLIKLAKEIVDKNNKETKRLDKIIYDWENREGSILNRYFGYKNDKHKEQEYFEAYTTRTFYGNVGVYKYLIEDLQNSDDHLVSIPCYLYNSLNKKGN